jgi:LPS sulfotransferase NodH
MVVSFAAADQNPTKSVNIWATPGIPDPAGRPGRNRLPVVAGRRPTREDRRMRTPLDASPAGGSRPSTAAVRDAIRATGVERSYTIAFAPRSGSTVLGNVLASRGFGDPAEWLHYPYPDDSPMMSGPGTRADRFVAAVRGWSAGSYSGLKLGHDHRAYLDGHLRPAIAGYRGIDDVLPHHRWIHITRRDVVAQAVSLHIAEGSGRWHLRQDEAHLPSAAVDVPYDFLAILYKVMSLLANDANWRTYFEVMGLEAVQVEYEALLDDPGAQLRRVAAHLDEDPALFADVDLDRDGGIRRISTEEPAGYASLRERFVEDFLAIGDPAHAARHGEALTAWDRFHSTRAWNDPARSSTPERTRDHLAAALGAARRRVTDVRSTWDARRGTGG